jgi:uncharacterized damage-inducible protein DinB
MLATFRDLFEHQAYADASLISAIRRHEPAARDTDLRTLLHHILIAHRYWIHLVQGLPFSADTERAVPESLEAIVNGYRQTHELERTWFARLHDQDLARTVESKHWPGRQIAISEALLQICLHSQGHRSQCASRLRTLGGMPPATDFILWLPERPRAVWQSSS